MHISLYILKVFAFILSWVCVLMIFNIVENNVDIQDYAAMPGFYLLDVLIHECGTLMTEYIIIAILTICAIATFLFFVDIPDILW